jgi:hypothetical protein
MQYCINALPKAPRPAGPGRHHHARRQAPDRRGRHSLFRDRAFHEDRAAVPGAEGPDRADWDSGTSTARTGNGWAS